MSTLQKMISYTLLLGLVFVMLGCVGGKPIVNIDNSQLLEKPAKISEMENAIKKGAAKRGWRAKKIKDGLFEVSQLIKNKFMVIVNINYTNKGYKVDYKSSTNLKYNSQTNTIHRKYNQWINNLVKDIDAEIYNSSL